MSSEFESLFAPGHSVWEAMTVVIEKIEPFRTVHKKMREGMYDQELAKVIALQDWRPRINVSSLFASFKNGARPECHYWVPSNRQVQPQDSSSWSQESSGSSDK